MRINKPTVYFFSVLLTLGLTACGGDSDISSKDAEAKKLSSNIQKENRSILTAKITGDTNENYVEKVRITCEKNLISLMYLGGSSQNYSYLELDIPLHLAKKGEHPVSGEDGVLSMNGEHLKSVLVAYDGLNNKRYGTKVKGTITLTSIPQKSGEHLIGHSIATAHSDASGVINIDMKFDIIADNETFLLCK